MGENKDTTIEAVLEHLIEHGPSDRATVCARAFELAMRIERERFLGASLYEGTPERQGYAYGCEPKRIDTPAGTVTVGVSKTAGHGGELGGLPASVLRTITRDNCGELARLVRVKKEDRAVGILP